MARNGSGTYNRVAGTPYVYNTVIDEFVVNNEFNDIATALTNSIAKDGQTVPTANLPMGGYKHTGAGSATANGQYLVYGQSADAVLSGDFGVGVTAVPANTRMIVDRIGTSPVPTLNAATVLTLAGSAAAASSAILQLVSGNAANTSIYFGDTDSASSGFIEYGHNVDNMRCVVNGTSEAWRAINGAFLVGTTSVLSPASTTGEGFSFSNSGTVVATMSRSAAPVFFLQRTTSDGAIAQFYRQTAQVGSISVTGAATAYNTSSDYRLKTNIEPMGNAIERLLQLNPGRFKWLSNLTGPAVDGFLAHEVSTVVPEAITGQRDAVEDVGEATRPERVWEEIAENSCPPGATWEKTGTLSIPAKQIIGDATNGEEVIHDILSDETPIGYIWKPTGIRITETQQDVGTAVLPESVIEGIAESEVPDGYTWVKTGTRPVYQGIDQSKLVPLLTASLQEAIELILDLQERVATLEASA